MRQAEGDPVDTQQARLSMSWLSASHGLSWLFFDGQAVWLGQGKWTSGPSSSEATGRHNQPSGPSFAALSFLELFEGPTSRVVEANAELRRLSVQEFFAWAQPMAEMAQDKVAWEPVGEAAWQAQWAWMQERWSTKAAAVSTPDAADEGGTSLRKAVPVIFERGWAACSNFQTWWLRRLLWSVRSAIETRAAGGSAWAYAYWDAQDAVLGVTPEILFELHGTRLQTHAVAGTRWVRDDQREAELREFLSASKDAEEQALVVDDLRARLSELAERHGGEVRVGERVARPASPRRGERQLWHLVTPLEWEMKSHGAPRAAELLRALHPTPALGVAPRSSASLRELDAVRVQQDGIARGNFGAPILISTSISTLSTTLISTSISTPTSSANPATLTALVGIRQIRVRREDSRDRFAVEVAAGAGVLPSSDPDLEWRELAVKRESIKRMLGLSAAQGNVEAGVEVLLKLIEAGARSFVYCAGARNAPLVAALELLRERFAALALPFEVVSHFEEREAAFFALGRARRDARPAVVICTSGTAVTELLPALTEALYVGAPLIALTADRPKRLRGTGAPQAIDQRQIFGRQVRRSIDFEVGDSLESFGEQLSVSALVDGPTHFNFCCDEPLLSGVEAAGQRVSKFNGPCAINAIASETAQDTLKSLRLDAQVATLMLVSGLQESAEIEAVAEFLCRAGRPVWLESTSGLRGDPRLKHLEIRSGEAALSRAIREGRVQHVWRLGAVPTTRIWRDLDDVRSPAECVSLSRTPWSGLGRGRHHAHPRWWTALSSLSVALPSGATAEAEAQWLKQSAQEASRLKELLRTHAVSEPAWFHFLSERIPAAARVYVGNSLPIREWDLAASRSPSALRRIEANRGVNGIDGQVSTALGLAHENDELWIVIGDLTALYNLAGPWLRERVRRLRIVVVNNGGGRIFSRVFRSAPGGSATFENRHAQSLAAWGELWDLECFVVRDHAAWPEVDDLDHVLIEIHPEAEATAQFWSAWEPST
ncbi:MAG TPA: 2-succinyl-5-enolpyruvyl-6-hydroxy-3-cyclohexene-1-carboxylic-acid synthase [Pseudobdellovibrionaceae bacterium]|nr:2-succinyl-5-enolpyruvyl-6-hydroxy-3-cyclohexene-1-carboxylic-acid synthase [Pseudobdellovibrionaceae bacterium]